MQALPTHAPPLLLLLGLVAAAPGCRDDPGSFSIRFLWEQAPEEPVWIWARAEKRPDPLKPGPILASAGPSLLEPGGRVSLEMGQIPNGTDRVVVVEVRDKADVSSPIRYYGISKPFSVEPGVHNVVEVSLRLRLPEAKGGLLLLIDGAPASVLDRQAFRRLTLQIRAQGAVKAYVANEPSFDEGACELSTQEDRPAVVCQGGDASFEATCKDSSTGGETWRVCEITEWDPVWHLGGNGSSVPDGRYTVYLKLRDAAGYASEVLTGSVALDTKTPFLVEEPLFRLGDAGLPFESPPEGVWTNRERAASVSFVLSEPAGTAPEISYGQLTHVLDGDTWTPEETAFSATLAPPKEGGAVELTLRVQDAAGNAATLPLGTIHYDYEPPAPLEGARQDRIRLLRAPWGSHLTEGAAATELRGCPAPPGAVVWAWCEGVKEPAFDEGSTIAILEVAEDGKTLACSEHVLVEATAGAAAEPTRVKLPGDWPAICVREVDRAGNATAAALVQNAIWVAAPTVDPDRVLSANPHLLWRVPDLRAKATPDAVAVTATAEERDAAGRAADGEVLSSRGERQWRAAVFEDLNPTGATSAAMAYDRARGRLVATVSWETDLAVETWEWDGRRWQDQTPEGPSPPARWHHAMSYHGPTGRVLLFGGIGQEDPAGADILDDTWEWDGARWTQLSPRSSPAPRHGHALASDGSRGLVVLFGGLTLGGFHLADLWEWDGVDWRLVQAKGAAPSQANHAMTYDSKRARVMLLGFGQLWAWEGARWKELEQGETKPGLRAGHGIAYDERSDKLVLFGGRAPPLGIRDVLDDTWTWDGAEWSEVAMSGSKPLPRSLHAMTYDPLRQSVVLFGGYAMGEGEYGTTFILSKDTWEWSGAVWTEATAAENTQRNVAGMGLAYDPGRERLVIYGGRHYDVSSPFPREWTGRRWETITPGYVSSPARRSAAPMVFHSGQGVTFLFGGSDYWPLGVSMSDTWTWDGVGWTEDVSVGDTPPPRTDHALAYDKKRDRVVLFGGRDEQSTFAGRQDTWEWDGQQWLEVEVEHPPPGRLQHGMAYDSARGRVVLFGGQSEQGFLGDTWEWDGAVWIEALPSGGSPERRTLHGLTYDEGRRRVVVHGGMTDDGAQLGDMWDFDGKEWRPLSSVGEVPPAREGHGIAYAPHAELITLVAGKSGGLSTSDVWTWNASAGLSPGVIFAVDWSAARRLSTVAVTGLELRTVAGGRGYTLDKLPGEDGDTVGEPLPGAALMLWDAWAGSWKTVAANEAALSAPEALEVTIQGPAEAARHVLQRDQMLYLAVGPKEPAGNGPEEAVVSVDALELRVEYELSAPEEP